MQGLRRLGDLETLGNLLPPAIRVWLAVAMVPVALGGLLFAAFGGVLLVPSWNLGTGRTHLLRSGARAQGSVVRLEIVESNLSDSSASIPTRAPVVRFQPPGHDPVEFSSQDLGQFTRHQAGDTVTVLYDPDNPSLAEIDSVLALSRPVAGVLLIGSAMLGFGLLFALAFLVAAMLLWRAHLHERRRRSLAVGSTSPPLG